MKLNFMKHKFDETQLNMKTTIDVREFKIFNFPSGLLLFLIHMLF